MIQPSPGRPLPEPGYGKAEEASQGSSAVTETQATQCTQQDAFDEAPVVVNHYQDPNAWGKLVWEETTRELVGEVIIGRRPACTIVVNDVKISGVHCKLTPPSKENSSPMIIDLSANGTFLNEELIGKENRSVLSHGDKISLLRMREGGRNHSFVFLDWKRSAPSAEEAVLGREYHVDKVLGTGNFSVVKEGLHRKSGKRVAIKIIEKRKFWNVPKTKEQILREVEILKSIQHPNIISVIDALDTPSHMYIILELASGGELFDRLMRGCCEETEARGIMRQIVMGVSYLHDKGIAHRDLKPENILLENSGPNPRVKITDFGLARIVGEREMMTTLCGTPQYVAPEIIVQGTYPDLVEKGYGLAVDIWSLGVILYVLLSGSPPFHEERSLSLFKQIEQGAYEFPPDQWRFISPEAVDLIQKMLQTDPRKRLSIAQVQQHPWLSGKDCPLSSTKSRASTQKKRTAVAVASSPTKPLQPQRTAILSRKRSRVAAGSQHISNSNNGNDNDNDNDNDNNNNNAQNVPPAVITVCDSPAASLAAPASAKTSAAALAARKGSASKRTRSAAKLRQSSTTDEDFLSATESRPPNPATATPVTAGSSAPKRAATARKHIATSPTEVHITAEQPQQLKSSTKAIIDSPAVEFKFSMPKPISPGNANQKSSGNTKKRLSYSER